MRSVRLVVLLSVLLLLAACGGGDDGQPAVEAPIIYTALGDSLAYGVGGSPGYVERYADHLRADLRAEVRPVFNLGFPGETSTGLAAIVRDQTVRAALSTSRVITLNIGGNDLREARSLRRSGACGGPDNLQCFRSTVASFKTNWDAILAEILAQRGGQPTVLRTMDIYNPYLGDDSPADTAATRPFLDEVNAHIHATAAARGFRVARVFEAFNGADGTQDPVARGLISSDGLHPNNAGYALIAEELRKLGYAPLR